MNTLNLPDKTTLFISENLNHYFRELGWLCRCLKREGLIHTYIYQNEAFFIKIKPNSDRKKKIIHKDDLIKLYPDFLRSHQALS